MIHGDTKRLRALFEMATDGIITMNERGVIENVNRAAGDLFGYSADELRGQKVNILMTDHDRAHHDNYLRRYQRTGEAHIIGIGREVTGRRKDGTGFPLRLAVSEVHVEGGTIYTGILHDLTDFHRARRHVEELNRDLETKVAERTETLRQRERELQQALGKERELNELKSRFLSLASHEFKTPLSTVLSSVELIELYEQTEQQPQRQRHIGRIKDAIGQLTEVLNDFLSLSRLEQGEVVAAPRPINLPALLSTCIENSEGQRKAGQRIELSVAPELNHLTTDPKLLRQAVINLLSNAAKYSGPDQRIEVRAVSAGQDRIAISITDEGIGIPDEDQQHLFDRFFRARNVENIKGTGLGLHLVHYYVQLLGGKVNFRSELGRGTTFTITLPTDLPHGER